MNTLPRRINVYLASRYSRYPEMQGYAKELAALGYHVTSRWIAGDDATEDMNDDQDKSRFALVDLVDIINSDWVLCFTEDPNDPPPMSSRGGRHVEMGFALASNYLVPSERHLAQRVVVVGPRENVFCWLPVVEHFDTWVGFIAATEDHKFLAGVANG